MTEPIRLTVGSAPFIHSGDSLRRRHFFLFAAALAGAVPGVIRYGMPAAAVLFLAVSTAMLWEIIMQAGLGRPSRAGDGGAALTGLLFGMLLPAGTPWWAVITGTGIAIFIGREIYGGGGGNPFHPVAVAVAILMVSWPHLFDLDMALLDFPVDFPAAWPLAAVKGLGSEAASAFSLQDLFSGRSISAIGTGCGIGLVSGGIFLMVTGVIRWEIPAGFLAGITLSAAGFHQMDPVAYTGPLFHLSTGITLFAAFFLAPEDSGSPVHRLPMFLYGLMGGVLTIVIRNIGAHVDGAVFAVLVMNLSSPILDRIRPGALGR